VFDDRREAHALVHALAESGIEVSVLRLRRRGTRGIEGYRLRPDIRVDDLGGGFGLGISEADGMQLMARLAGAKSGVG
jgi:hypothetical protein